MSFFYKENANPQSSNAFANGSDQNCGNVITDRPTTRLHAPPGGHSSICFGAAPEDRVRSTTYAAQDRATNSPSAVQSQVFGAPSAARGNSSNAYANGADQNCGNFITDRPTTRLHEPPGGRSQISFGGGDVSMAPTRRPDTAAFAAKEREQAGSDIFGAGPAPVAQAADVWSAEAEAPPPAFLEATAENIKAMMHQELRELCRAHGLSPAGAKNTLVERVCEAMVTGQIRVQVANRGVSGVAGVGNNYDRSQGQNVGNFLTGRNSSRVLAPPGGGSSFSLGGYGGEPEPAARTNVTSQAKHHEIIGNDIFSDGSTVSSRALSDAKISHLQGHDVFSDQPNAFVPGKQVSHAKMRRDYQGSDVFSDEAEPRRPGTALSTAKAADMKGQDIFSDGPRWNDGEVSGARAAAVAGMRGSDVFSDGADASRSSGRCTNPPGGASSIVF